MSKQKDQYVKWTKRIEQNWLKDEERKPNTLQML